jgi:hypothetical protein
MSATADAITPVALPQPNPTTIVAEADAITSVPPPIPIADIDAITPIPSPYPAIMVPSKPQSVALPAMTPPKSEHHFHIPHPHVHMPHPHLHVKKHVDHWVEDVADVYGRVAWVLCIRRMEEWRGKYTDAVMGRKRGVSKDEWGWREQGDGKPTFRGISVVFLMICCS